MGLLMSAFVFHDTVTISMLGETKTKKACQTPEPFVLFTPIIFNIGSRISHIFSPS